MSKRVHEIAKEHGLPPREALERLRAAGMNIKSVSSGVDEDTALQALGVNGKKAPAAAPSATPAAAAPAAPAGEGAANGAASAKPAPRAQTARKAASRGGSGASAEPAAGASGAAKPAAGAPVAAKPVRGAPAGARPASAAGARPASPPGSAAGARSASPPASAAGAKPAPGARPSTRPLSGPRAASPASAGTTPPSRPAGAIPGNPPRRVADPDDAAGLTATAGSASRRAGAGGPGADPRLGRGGTPGAGGARDPGGPQVRLPGIPGMTPATPRDPRIGKPQAPRPAARPASTSGQGQQRPGAGQSRGKRADGQGAQAPARQEEQRQAASQRGAAPQAGTAPAAPARAAQDSTAGAAPAADTAGTAAGEAGAGRGGEHKRPTRDSLQGERSPAAAGAGGRRRVVIDSQASRRAPGGPGGPASQPPRRQRRGRRRRGVYDEEAESRPTHVLTDEPVRDLVRINSGSTVKDVAEYLSVPVPEVMKKLMGLGEMKTLTQTLSDDSIQVLAAELGKDVEIVHTEDETVAEPVFDDPEDQLVERPPVVTIMGHVDHGKTSLLDAIRETEVAAGEAGGITQHIGAYQVHHDGKTITFLDTPGHEAFTAMRARGAKVTDLAVIVVAADDGVKPQTQEAVDHAKEADVPVLVAVNKIDKEGADPARVRTEMTGLGLQPVEWGGETEFVDVSARTKDGLDTLLETILVMAEVEELQANPSVEASGTVIESKLDPGRGPVVTILIERGTLRVGDALVAGAHWGRVRAMNDFTGSRTTQALPGEPVEVLGFDGVPEAGEHVRVVDHERRARQLAAERATRLKSESLARRSNKRISLEDIAGGEVNELNLVVKADVAGSLEAIEDEIAKLPQDEVSVNVIRRAVGAVTESDVMLAAASDAVILSFNVRPVGEARSVAEREGIEIRHYSVIYRAIEDLRQAMEGMLAPEEVEESLGSAEVRQIFRASRVGTIAGSHVSEGRITRGAKVRLVRDGTVVYDGEIASLRRFNEDAREVAAGFECGVVLRDFADIKEGDVLEAYATRQVERELA